MRDLFGYIYLCNVGAGSVFVSFCLDLHQLPPTSLLLIIDLSPSKKNISRINVRSMYINSASFLYLSTSHQQGSMLATVFNYTCTRN